MKKDINLSFINRLCDLKKTNWSLIQVILGPRQVGKTTGIEQFLVRLSASDFHYMSADGQISRHSSWVEEQWLILKAKNPTGYLVLDEIQKVENWSEIVKKLWDQQKKEKTNIKLILLGSSSLEIQKGLSESLTGRFFLSKVYQWNLDESQRGYDLDLENFLVFGGYPGSYSMIQDRATWLGYMRESIVETVIGKDILKNSRVKSPALFKQCFDLACSYGGQEISYTKLLGQLQDKGNVEVVKHYLELFEGAFLIKQLQKYSAKKVLSRASSPKILPLCPALFSMTLDADLDPMQRGRAFEIAVGCELMRLPGSLYYWRQGSDEVDYIYVYGRRVCAIEVKSGRKKTIKGLSRFLAEFAGSEGFVVTPENYQSVIAALQGSEK